jgi:GNAT superfamily N-acetyltransferase
MMPLIQVVSKDYEVHGKLRNGQSVVLRAIQSDDKAILVDEMKHLSRESIYFRFFTPKTKLSREELIYFSELDLVNHVGLLASVVDDSGQEFPAGAGRYIVSKEPSDVIRAELAFEVREEFQGLGIATLLLQELIEIGQAAGIEEFFALVLCENRKMLDVFEHLPYLLTKTLAPFGIVRVSFSLKKK